MKVARGQRGWFFPLIRRCTTWMEPWVLPACYGVLETICHLATLIEDVLE
jgi:hypothetical protein